MALTEPDFIERDADKITAEMIAKYEADTGKTLYPAQAERLLIDLWAYREMLVRVAVQEAAKQNLVAFAREPMIDYLGELVGVYRLAAQPATTTLQFSVDEALAIDVLIPAGTRVSASDSVIFATDTDVDRRPDCCWSMSRPPVPNPVPLVTAGNLRRSVSYSMRLITLTCW